MYKIRLTDSVTILKFTILKPEFEADFADDTPLNSALEAVTQDLATSVDYQLKTIAARMTKAQVASTLRDASIDPRFRTILEAM